MFVLLVVFNVIIIAENLTGGGINFIVILHVIAALLVDEFNFVYAAAMLPVLLGLDKLYLISGFVGMIQGNFLGLLDGNAAIVGALGGSAVGVKGGSTKVGKGTGSYSCRQYHGTGHNF